jgi:transcriptional regulator with XRE-family HTH domain
MRNTGKLKTFLSMARGAASQKAEFGDMLIQLRSDNRLTQRQLADALEVSPAFLCDVEQGRRNFSDELLAKLEGIL